VKIGKQFMWSNKIAPKWSNGSAAAEKPDTTTGAETNL